MTEQQKIRIEDAAAYGKFLVEENAGAVEFRHYGRGGDKPRKISNDYNYDPTIYGSVANQTGKVKSQKGAHARV